MLFMPAHWRVPRQATVGALRDAFLTRCRAEQLSPYTVRAYAASLKRFVAFCEQSRLTDPRTLTPDHLGELKAYLAQSGNKVSVASWLRDVRAMLYWAKSRGYLEVSPFRDWSIERVHLPAQKGFTPLPCHPQAKSV